MERFKINGYKLEKYIGDNNVIIDIFPEGVIKIGKLAFSNCNRLTSITISDNVTEIGESAFLGCSLTHIELPKNVVKIGDYAFAACLNLKSIKFNCKILKIPNFAFSSCVNLTNITIPESVRTIGESAFYNCKNLTNITIPYSVTEIGNYAFDNCENLTSITLSRNITKIGYSVFDCRYVQEINVYSYKVFSLLSEIAKIIAIISTIKNYYTEKIQYSDEDMNLFKEYIRKNKITIFNKIKESKEMIHAILFEMDNFLTFNDVGELLIQNIDIEINAMLTEYSNKIRNENINPLDEYDLGSFNTDSFEDNKQKRI